MKRKKKVSNEYIDYEEIETKRKNLDDIVSGIIDSNPKLLLDYKAGVRSALDELITEVMKKSGGRADPQKIRTIIINKL